MFGSQIESFYASIEGLLPFMFTVFAVFVSTPLVLMVFRGRIARGIELLGNMLLGFMAMSSIIFLPVGMNIFWGVYREALSHYIVTEETQNS
jgi:hypothetical protein